jgi:peroxiredoxin
MIRYAAAASLLVGALAVGLAQAGGEKMFKIGAPAPTFTALPGVDGKDHSLSDYKNKDVLVIAITCNHCPVARAYEKRLVEFATKYAKPDSKVAFVAINVNNLPEDKLDKMKVRAKQQGFNFPYLYDASQKIARALNAKVTPEFYVFDKSRKLVYWGAMDDNNNAGNAKVNYLANAVEATLKGQTPATARTNARGCSVKYE